MRANRQYSLYIYSPLGPCLTHFNPASPGFNLAKGEDPGMGIRVVTWGPGGRWLATGGWDNKVRIIESDGWRCVGLMSWGTRVNDNSVVSLPSSDLWRRLIGCRWYGKSQATGSRILADAALCSVCRDEPCRHECRADQQSTACQVQPYYPGSG